MYCFYACVSGSHIGLHECRSLGPSQPAIQLLSSSERLRARAGLQRSVLSSPPQNAMHPSRRPCQPSRLRAVSGEWRRRMPQ